MSLQSMSDAPRYKVRITVLGGPRCGKTTLVERFFTKAVAGPTLPTIENLWRKVHTVSDIAYDLEVVDTSGDPRILALYLDEYLDESDAFLCTYATDDVNSIAFLEDLLPRIGVDRTQLGRTNRGTPVLVAANERHGIGSRDMDGKTVALNMMLPWVAVNPDSNSSVAVAFEKLMTRGSTAFTGLVRNGSESNIHKIRGQLWKMRSLSEMRVSVEDVSEPDAPDLIMTRSLSDRVHANSRLRAKERLQELKKRMFASWRPLHSPDPSHS